MPRQLLTVADTRVLKGRGIVVAPHLPLAPFAQPTELELEVRSPAGSWRARASVEPVHARMLAGGSPWHWCVIVPEGAERPPPGAELRTTD